MPNDTSSFIQTWSGKKFDFQNPLPAAITMEDIAHALAQIPRFGGHLDRFYSVADHSLNVAHMVAWRGANLPTIRCALLHDSGEAYLGDIVTPFKRMLPQAVELETRLLAIIHKKFAIVEREVDFTAIKRADEAMLVMEAKFLFREPPIEHWTDAYCSDALAAPSHISRNAREAEMYFLSAIRVLFGTSLQVVCTPEWHNAEKELPAVGQLCEILTADSPDHPGAVMKAALRRCDNGWGEYVWVNGENLDLLVSNVLKWRPLTERALKNARLVQGRVNVIEP